jgi:PBP1b-binding outer membrane lipoprotein LpoB
MYKILSVIAISALLLSGCGSKSDGDEVSSSGMASSQNQKMLANCDTLQNVTSAFTDEYFKGNYAAATEALMVRPGSLATISQTEEENKLINDITSQIPTALSLMQAGNYQEILTSDFMLAINKYNGFCLSVAFAE